MPDFTGILEMPSTFGFIPNSSGSTMYVPLVTSIVATIDAKIGFAERIEVDDNPNAVDFKPIAAAEDDPVIVVSAAATLFDVTTMCDEGSIDGNIEDPLDVTGSADPEFKRESDTAEIFSGIGVYTSGIGLS